LTPEPILSVKNLSIHFDTPDGRVVRAVEGFELDFAPGKVMGIVGESGCGKTITARAIMGILPPGGRIVSGEAFFSGMNLFTLPSSKRRALCGKRIAMIFQEPATALNPVLRVGDQVAEVITQHLRLPKKKAMEKATGFLSATSIPQPELKARYYPNQLSGGMRQRVAIAQALAANPDLLIADEPTTALDVTVQAQVVRLFARLAKQPARAVWLITHDLGVVAELADEVAVMYAGKIVEKGSVETIFDEPAHPYTKGLLEAVKLLDRGDIRSSISGSVPDLADLPHGCRFHPRCASRMPRCLKDIPPEFEFLSGHRASCWLYADNSKESK